MPFVNETCPFVQRAPPSLAVFACSANSLSTNELDALTANAGEVLFLLCVIRMLSEVEGELACTWLAQRDCIEQ